jgi:hypothetical protein
MDELSIPSIKPGHSAAVDMWLDCGPHGTVPLSHVSSTFVITAAPVSIPKCDARILLAVDGQRFDRHVTLPDGVSPDSREVPVWSRDTVAPF